MEVDSHQATCAWSSYGLCFFEWKASWSAKWGELDVAIGMVLESWPDLSRLGSLRALELESWMVTRLLDFSSSATVGDRSACDSTAPRRGMPITIHAVRAI